MPVFGDHRGTYGYAGHGSARAGAGHGHGDRHPTRTGILREPLGESTVTLRADLSRRRHTAVAAAVGNVPVSTEVTRVTFVTGAPDLR